MNIPGSQGDLTSGSVFFATVDEDGKRNILYTSRHNAVEPDYYYRPVHSGIVYRSISYGILFERPTDKFPNNPYQKVIINAAVSFSIKRDGEVNAGCNAKLWYGGFIKSEYGTFYPKYNRFRQTNSEWTYSSSNVYTQQTTVKNMSYTVVGHIDRKMTLSGEIFSNLYDGVLVERDEETETYSRTKGPAYTDFTQKPIDRSGTDWIEGVFLDCSSQADGTTKKYYGRVTIEITNDFDEFFYEMLFSGDGYSNADPEDMLFYPDESSDLTIESATITLQ